jgi:hypothetical protein
MINNNYGGIKTWQIEQLRLILQGFPAIKKKVGGGGK